jgi:hypothetical protein
MSLRPPANLHGLCDAPDNPDLVQERRARRLPTGFATRVAVRATALPVGAADLFGRGAVIDQPEATERPISSECSLSTM